MNIFYLIIAVIASVALGYIIGRETTKCECGKMFRVLEESGCLRLPFEDDDEEDFK